MRKLKYFWKGIMFSQHGIKGPHCICIQLFVPFQAMVGRFFAIIEVVLRIDRGLSGCKLQCSNLMINLAVNLKWTESVAMSKPIIKLNSKRSESKSGAILPDILAKFNCILRLRCQKGFERLRRVYKRL